MYQDEGMLGSRNPISPEDLFLETQFSLTTTNDPIPGPGFDVPIYQRPRFVNDEQEVLDVQIRHRTRTQKGWTSITPEDKIRVTKDRGKVFQLIIDSPLPFSKESVSLGLELNGQPIDAAAGGLKVVKISSVSSRTDNTRTRYSAEVSIKISALCERLRVIASVACDPTHVLTGRTVEFMTHNNGKVSNQRDEMEIQPKKLQPVAPQQSPPPNPNEHCAVHNGHNNKRSHAQHTQQQQHYQQQPHQVYPQDSLILNNNAQTFRGDQRQHIQGYTSPPTSGVKGGGSGGKKKGNTLSNHGNNDNMNILYNKLMKDAPESPPHPQVGDCSSPEYNIGGEEPPLSQMKKRKYNNNNVTQSPVRLESPPHPTAGYTPQQPYLGNYPVQQQHPQQQHYYNNYPVQQQHPQQQYVQHPPQLYAATPGYNHNNNNNKFNGGFSGDSSYSHTDSSSTTSSARNSVTLNGDVTWGNASFSPQSTPEEEFEMQEMAAGASGQGSEEEEYGGSFNAKVGMAPKGVASSAAQVINGDLSVRGAVRARAYMQYSDIRLKTDVEDIVDAIDLISKLDGKRYRWKPEAFSEKSLSVPSDDADVISRSSDSDEFSDDDDDIESSVGSAIPLLDGKTSVFKNFGFSAKTDLEEDRTKKGHKVIGLIAQEVQRILPEVVTEDEDGYLAVAYAEIVPVLISAFNEHMSKYNQEQMVLKKRFDEFEVQLEAITEEKEDLTDKETLAHLAQEMKELIPETPYSRLVKKLSSIRRRDRIIQRNCCCLLALLFCFVIGLSIALAIIGPVTFQNVYNVVSPITDNNNNNNNNNNVIPGGTRAYELLSITSTSARLGGLRTDATDTIDSLSFSVLLSSSPPNDPLSVYVLHTVTPPTNRRRQEIVDKESVDNQDLLYVRDTSDTTLNYTVSLVSFFKYEESNGQPGYQTGESITNLLTPTTAKWAALSSRTLKGTNNNGEVTIICVSSTANSILTLEMCVADQSCVYNGVAYSANGLHLKGWTNLTLSSEDRYGMTIYYGSRSKSTVTYDVVTPSLIYQEDNNSVSVGQLTWQHSFSTNATIVPSWKSGPSTMTFSFAGSDDAFEVSPPSWYFDAAVQYIS